MLTFIDAKNLIEKKCQHCSVLMPPDSLAFVISLPAIKDNVKFCKSCFTMIVDDYNIYMKGLK